MEIRSPVSLSLVGIGASLTALGISHTISVHEWI
jgi:hypothetical protein